MFNPCNPLGIGLLDFFGINELLTDVTQRI